MQAQISDGVLPLHIRPRIINAMEISGARVKLRRKALEITQEKLAEAVGVSQGSIARIEKGDTPDPRGSTLRRLAQALRTSTSYLCGESDDPEASPADEQESPRSDLADAAVPTLSQLPNWAQLVEGAMALDDRVPAWPYERLGHRHAMLEGPLTPAAVRDLAKVLMKYEAPPPANDTGKRAR